MNKLKPRILLAAVLCLVGIFVALGGAGLYSRLFQSPGTVRAGIGGAYSKRLWRAGRGASGRPGCLEH